MTSAPFVRFRRCQQKCSGAPTAVQTAGIKYEAETPIVSEVLVSVTVTPSVFSRSLPAELTVSVQNDDEDVQPEKILCLAANGGARVGTVHA